MLKRRISEVNRIDDGFVHEDAHRIPYVNKVIIVINFHKQLDL